MSVVTEAEEILLNLPLRERGEFAVRLLATLRPPEEDGDAIIAEAIRRSEELTRDPSIGLSLADLDRRMLEKFGEGRNRSTVSRVLRHRR